jgi:hypothetical protein
MHEQYLDTWSLRAARASSDARFALNIFENKTSVLLHRGSVMVRDSLVRKECVCGVCDLIYVACRRTDYAFRDRNRVFCAF